MGKVVLPTHRAAAKTPPCPTHSQKWLPPYLAWGLLTLQKRHRELIENMKDSVTKKSVFLRRN
jgi:hypothetical protein